ncbi:hypothetical protein LTS08_000527 [Lithohypha guttulata]|nr:hypothetical protein LTS08_000527 [Lithohypha guttulata]
MSPPSNRRITKELEHIIEDIMKQRAEIEKYRQWVRETPVKPRSESDLEGLTSFFGMLRNAIEDQIMGRIVKYEKHLDAKDGYINLLIENGASRVAAEWRYRLDGRLNQVYGAVQQCHGEMENVLGVKEHRGKERHSPDTKSRTQQKDKKTKIKKNHSNQPQGETTGEHTTPERGSSTTHTTTAREEANEDRADSGYQGSSADSTEARASSTTDRASNTSARASSTRATRSTTPATSDNSSSRRSSNRFRDHDTDRTRPRQRHYNMPTTDEKRKARARHEALLSDRYSERASEGLRMIAESFGLEGRRGRRGSNGVMSRLGRFVNVR